MCWRDDIHQNRICFACGNAYYGDLGHRNCPKRIPTESKPVDPPEERKRNKRPKKPAKNTLNAHATRPRSGFLLYKNTSFEVFLWRVRRDSNQKRNK